MKTETNFKQTEIGLIPKDWEVKKAEDFCFKVTDGTHDSPKQKESGFYLITSKHLKLHTLDFENAYFISKEDYDFINRRSEVNQYDILFSMIGTVGECYIEQNEKINYAIKNIGLFKFNKNRENALWFYYFLKSPVGREYIENRKVGSTQQYLTLKSLREFLIAVPPLQEQQAIAKILSDLDEKIEINKKINENLESIGQALFKRWFVDFEFPDEKGKPYKSNGGEMIESELGEIPKDWKIDFVENHLTTVLGGTPSREKKEYWTNGTVAWINSGEVNKFRIIQASEYITEDAVKKSATKILPKKTVVLAITGATLGQISILGIDSCANQSVVGILEKEEFSSEFIYFWFKEIMKDLINMQSGGAHQHVNKNNINKSKLLVPDKKILLKYNKVITPVFDQIIENCLEIQKLEQIRDSLLPKLMSGQIRVK